MAATAIIELMEEKMKDLHDDLDRSIDQHDDKAVELDILSKLELLTELHAEAIIIKNSLQ